jgi:hypothetical protein
MTRSEDPLRRRIPPPNNPRRRRRRKSVGVPPNYISAATAIFFPGVAA